MGERERMDCMPLLDVAHHNEVTKWCSAMYVMCCETTQYTVSHDTVHEGKMTHSITQNNMIKHSMAHHVDSEQCYTMHLKHIGLLVMISETVRSCSSTWLLTPSSSSRK